MGKIDRERAIANIEIYFEQIIIEILRGVANGKQRNPDIGHYLLKMAQIAFDAEEIKVREVYELIDRAITRASEAIASDEFICHVVQSSLRFAAELNARDNAAAGRASQRRNTLTAAISTYESRMLYLRSMNSTKTNRFTIPQGKT